MSVSVGRSCLGTCACDGATLPWDVSTHAVGIGSENVYYVSQLVGEIQLPSSGKDRRRGRARQRRGSLLSGCCIATRCVIELPHVGAAGRATARMRFVRSSGFVSTGGGGVRPSAPASGGMNGDARRLRAACLRLPRVVGGRKDVSTNLGGTIVLPVGILGFVRTRTAPPCSRQQVGPTCLIRPLPTEPTNPASDSAALFKFLDAKFPFSPSFMPKGPGRGKGTSPGNGAEHGFCSSPPPKQLAAETLDRSCAPATNAGRWSNQDKFAREPGLVCTTQCVPAVWVWTVAGARGKAWSPPSSGTFVLLGLY